MADKLIIGCGYLGRRIAALWRAQNHRVFATTRSAARPTSGEHFAFIRSYATLDPALPLCRVDSIVHCIGLDRSTGVSMRCLYVDGWQMCWLHCLNPFHVFTSAARAYGQTDGVEVDETATTGRKRNRGVVLKPSACVQLPGPSSFRFAGIWS